MSTPTNTSSLLKYGILALPLAFGGIPLYLYAPDFYATEVGLSLASLGALLLVLRLVDAASDPLWGWLTDHWPNRRTTILNIAFAAYLFGFVALFNPVEGAGMLWFAMAILFATCGYSLLVIQLNALGASWSSNQLDLVGINSVREGFGLMGLIFAAVTPAILLNYFSKGQAFTFITIALIALLILSHRCLFSWLSHRNQTPTELSSTTKGYTRSAKTVIWPARAFFATYGLSTLASACPAVLIVFFVRDYLDLEAWTGIFLILYFFSGIAFMPLWKLIAGRFGSTFAWAASMLLAIITFSGVLLLSAGDFLGFALVCFFSGMAFGAELVIPPTILAQYLHRSNALAQAGIAYSLLAFLSKLALALSAGLLFWILEINQFTPAAQNDESAKLMLLYCYGLAPLVLKLIALFVLLTFRGNKANETNDIQGVLYMDRSYDY